jgi:hypothetical protein
MLFVGRRSLTTGDLNPLAARVYAALTHVHPEFAANATKLANGDVELFVAAGTGSKAGALMVSTARGEDIWIRFAPPQMFYAIDDTDELLTIVDALLNERVMFVRLAGPHDEWICTTLVTRGRPVDLEDARSAIVRSWSGRFDQELVAQTPAPSWIEFHDSQLLAVNVIDSGVELQLAAYVHAWETNGDVRRGTGWVQPVRIRLIDARSPAIAEGLPLFLDGGEIMAGEQSHRECVPLPFIATQPAVLRLEFTAGHMIEVTAAKLEISATGPARYVEDLPAALWPGPAA